ncbi:MAG: adenylate cyclase [Gaiellaceae bacterium]
MATATRPARSDEELQELLGLIKGADTVELKLTIPEEAHQGTAQALGMDPLAAELRQVFFYDTPDLALEQAGVVVRARRSQKKGDDTVVKLRPVVPAELPRSLRRTEGFGVEVDASPAGFVCSASFKGAPTAGSVRETVISGRPLRKLFTKAQRAFYEEHAPEGLGLDDLRMLGPLLVLKLKFSPEGFERRMVAEVWLYPDGSRVLELSTKCATNEAFEVGAEARAFLASKGVELGGEQQTKTRMALEFYAKNLVGAANGKRRPARKQAAAG